MGQPTPPGDNVPLFEGLDSSWNDVVSAFPEDRRSELAGSIKSRIDSYEPYKQWDNLQKSGVTPDQASAALNLYSIIENNPRQVYDTLAQHLGISPQQAQQVVEDLDDAIEEDPRDAELQHLRQQIETISQIMVTQNQQTRQQQLDEQANKELNDQLEGLRKKYGDIDEQQVIMHMLHLDMSAEDAYKAYTGRDDTIRQRRPAPMLLSSGGAIPNRAIDPTKLNSAETKNLVAQMLQHGTQNR
jgi:polyhydroxyalkanoate synthesis regulator phasin